MNEWIPFHSSWFSAVINCYEFLMAYTICRLFSVRSDNSYMKTRIYDLVWRRSYKEYIFPINLINRRDVKYLMWRFGFWAWHALYTFNFSMPSVIFGQPEAILTVGIKCECCAFFVGVRLYYKCLSFGNGFSHVAEKICIGLDRWSSLVDI